jgi:hypothetical protein
VPRAGPLQERDDLADCAAPPASDLIPHTANPAPYDHRKEKARNRHIDDEIVSSAAQLTRGALDNRLLMEDEAEYRGFDAEQTQTLREACPGVWTGRPVRWPCARPRRGHPSLNSTMRTPRTWTTAVDHEYPDFGEVADEITAAMWEAAMFVLEERKLEDPLLRAPADERATLWIWATVPAGMLPLGTSILVKIGHDTYEGKLRRRDRYDGPEFGTDRLGVDWQGRRFGARYLDLAADTEVEVRVPVPFDLSALLAQIERETGARRSPRWYRLGRCRLPVRRPESRGTGASPA